MNIDWPSRTGLTAAQQQAELIGWLDDAVRQRHNAVVLQIRPTADAFWPSAVEPWSKYLTGTQGGDPGWDPLAFAVAEAHRRNLELHGWFNPYRLSMDTDLAALVPSHPARQHPDWVVTYGGKLYYNPGIPAARRLVEDAIMDAVNRYDLDAVHFDDYFYPYPVAGQTFDDAAAYAEHGAGLSLPDWRRRNIDLLITELGQRIKQAKPQVKFGISPFAVWRNGATDPAGSATTAGVQTYDDLYADTRGWGPRGLDRLHRAAGLLGAGLRGRRLRRAGAVVGRAGPRHSGAPLHRPGDVQGRHVDSRRTGPIRWSCPTTWPGTARFPR